MDPNRAYTGTVIRDGDGNFYLIKEEVLAQSKIHDPEFVKALKALVAEGDTKGYAFAPAQGAFPQIGAGFAALRFTPQLKLKVC